MGIKFKDYIKEEASTSLMEARMTGLVYMLENVDMMNESAQADEALLEGVNDYLKKMGVKAERTKGLIDYFKSIGSGVGSIFMALIKGDAEKAKAILKTVSKADVIDFLMKLDLGTLHIFMSTVHTIEAWTGYNLEADIKQRIDQAKDIYQTIKQALNKVKENIVKVLNPKQHKSALSNIKRLEKQVLPA